MYKYSYTRWTVPHGSETPTHVFFKFWIGETSYIHSIHASLDNPESVLYTWAEALRAAKKVTAAYNNTLTPL